MIRKFETPVGEDQRETGESYFSGNPSTAQANVSSEIPTEQSDKVRAAEKPATITTLVVSPNLSMSWRANLLLVAGIAFICIGTGIVWAYFGLWLVLPFAGLEVLFVTVCLYLTVRKLSRKEVITIDANEIKLEWGLYEPQQSVTLPRHWSKLEYQCDDSPFEVGSLTLGAHGKYYPLGLSLGRDEKRSLYRQLYQLL